MASQYGDFVWYELMTTDVTAAAAFYGAVVGWSNRPFDAADSSGYQLFSTGKAEIAGLMTLPEIDGGETGEKPHPGWIGYIGVESVDATAAAILNDGGRQYVPPTDIPGVGRFAVVADPQGVVFSLISGTTEDESHAFDPQGVGHGRWNELTTTDPEAAFAFYSRHFGWTKGEAMPMGEAGVYQLLDHHGVTFGAVTPLGAEAQKPAWAFYFGVPDIDAAIAKIGEANGQVLHGPHEVPGGECIVIGRDPQGAYFALVGPRKA